MPRRSQKLVRWLTTKYDRMVAQIANWTMQILEAYISFPNVHRHGESPIPTTRDTVRLLNQILPITSPGYGRRVSSNLDNTPEQTKVRVTYIFKKLATLAELDLRFPDSPGGKQDRNFRTEARELAGKFIEKIPELMQRLEEDCETMVLNDPAAKSIELVLSCYPGVYAVRVYRIGHLLHSLGLNLIPRLLTEHAHSKTGIDIHPGATIGRRFVIDHGTGVVIGETTIVGDDVTIYQGSTIGAQKLPRDDDGSVSHDPSIKRHPTIGNRVTIYANATILGGDTVIGDDVVIGSSTWIEDSVESGMKVLNEKPTQRYFKNRPRSKAPIDAEARERFERERLDLEAQIASWEGEGGNTGRPRWRASDHSLGGCEGGLDG